MKIHFYRSTMPQFLPTYDYCDYSHGIVGYAEKQNIKNRYIGYMTVDELNRLIREQVKKPHRRTPFAV